MKAKGCMPLPPFPAHGLHSRDDARVGAAAADVAAHALAHIGVARSARLVEERHRRHDLAGRAVAALEAVVIDERLLYRMQTIAVGETFDRRDLAARRGCGKRQ